MSDFTLQAQHTGIVGMTGCGKTTFEIRHLLNDTSAACRFIFDDLNRMAPRLKIPMCYSPDDLENSLPTRWSAFNPVKMLPRFNGDMKRAFQWWIRWVFHVAGRGPGKKMVCIPEVWRHCNPDSIPHELALLAQAGRELHVELILDTQRPELLNGSITASLTELVVFRQMSPDARRATDRLLLETGIVPPESLRTLPLGSFIGFNRLSNASRAGRVF